MMIDHDPSSIKAAMDFLRSIGAPLRVQRHAEIVAEVAIEISLAFAQSALSHDENLVAVGSAIHDIGKFVHPEELSEPGKKHESAGEIFLLDKGFSPKLARICRTHSSWDNAQTTFEEKIIALAATFGKALEMSYWRV